MEDHVTYRKISVDLKSQISSSSWKPISTSKPPVILTSHHNHDLINPLIPNVAIRVQE